MRGLTKNQIKALLVLLPCVVVTFYFIWAFGGYTVFLAFTKSTFLPDHNLVGLQNFVTLFADKRWWVAYTNMFIYGFIFVAGCIIGGILLAVLLDQATKGENLFRTIYLYPMSLSLVVTGLAWKWLLNPTSGIQQIVRDLGFTDFKFNWLTTPGYSIYVIAFAAIWANVGLIMMLFLAGIKSVDSEIWKAAKIDRIPTWRVYFNIILPQQRTTLLTSIMLLGFSVIRSFDVVINLTGGGPGYSSNVPAQYVYEFFFARSKIGIGAAGAVMMVATMIAIILPYLIYEVRRKD